MKKIVVYGSHLWKDCPPLKEFLSEKGIKFAYFDISLDLGALKRFLRLRDSNPLFDGVREKGGIGLPAIIIDDEVMIDFDREKLEEML